VEIAVFADNLATVILLFFLAVCMRRPIANNATVASLLSVSANRFAPYNPESWRVNIKQGRLQQSYLPNLGIGIQFVLIQR
jgi:hypothetical protein